METCKWKEKERVRYSNLLYETVLEKIPESKAKAIEEDII